MKINNKASIQSGKSHKVTLSPVIAPNGTRATITMITRPNGNVSLRVSHCPAKGMRVRKCFKSEAAARAYARFLLGNHQLSAFKAQGKSLSDLLADSRAMAYLQQEAAKVGMDPLTAVQILITAMEIMGGKAILPAVRYYRDHVDTFKPLRLSELLDSQIKALERHKRSSAHIKKTKFYLERAIEHVGDMEVHLMTEELAVDTIYDLYPHDRTRSEMGRILNHSWQFARKKKGLPLNFDLPLISNEDLEFVPTDPKIITPSAFELLLSQATREEFILTLVLRGLLGLRAKEARLMQWDYFHFDEEKPTLFVPQGVGKGKKQRRNSRTVDLTPAAIAWLTPLRRESGPMFETIRPDANVQDFGRRIGVKWENNFLRHAYVSYMIEIKKDDAYVANQAGHSVKMQQSVYRQPALHKDAVAFFTVLPDWKNHPLLATSEAVQQFVAKQAAKIAA